MAKTILQEVWDATPAQGSPGDDFAMGKVQVMGSWNKQITDTEDGSTRMSGGFVILPEVSGETTLINAGTLKTLAKTEPKCVVDVNGNYALNISKYKFARAANKLSCESIS